MTPDGAPRGRVTMFAMEIDDQVAGPGRVLVLLDVDLADVRSGRVKIYTDVEIREVKS